MARLFWCRLCQYEIEVTAGNFPVRCAACRHRARWTSLSPWRLTPFDCEFLRRLKIAAT